MGIRLGRQTVMLSTPPAVIGYAGVVGQKEGEGPLKGCFDYISDDSYFGEKSWEKAESHMIKQCFQIACGKAGLAPEGLDYIFSGDLLNQCVSSAFAMKDCKAPYMGVYGACSTMAESLGLAAMVIDGGFAAKACALTGSHFCSAERQFRFPLNYGGVRTPTAQWTATAAGAAIVSSVPKAPYIRAATIGKIQDMGIKDLNNMGAAMAGAAYDTISRHFRHMGTHPESYDLIITGDLGQVGSEMLYELFRRDGVSIEKWHKDCGLMIFDREKQDVHAGGSGCGCSASIMCAHFLKRVESGDLKRILFCATGALMSPTMVQQGGSIPGIAHAVEITSK